MSLRIISQKKKSMDGYAGFAEFEHAHESHRQRNKNKIQLFQHTSCISFSSSLCPLPVMGAVPKFPKVLSMT